MTKPSKHFLTNPIVVALLASLACFLWGSAIPFIKTGYRQFQVASGDYASQIFFAGFRFFLAGILAIGFGSIASKKLLIPKKTSWGNLAKLAITQTFFQYLFFYIGVANTNGVKSSIITGTGVFITLLIACLFFKSEKMTAKKWLGCILGFIGLAMVNLQGSQGMDFSFTLLGDGFILTSTVFSSIASVLLKKYAQSEHPVVLSGYQLTLGGIALILVGFLTGGKLQATTPWGYLTYFYLAFLSAAAFSIWGILLKRNDISKVSVYKFSIPLFGVLLSTLMLEEQGNLFSVSILIPLVLISFGVVIVNQKEKTH